LQKILHALGVKLGPRHPDLVRVIHSVLRVATVNAMHAKGHGLACQLDTAVTQQLHGHFTGEQTEYTFAPVKMQAPHLQALSPMTSRCELARMFRWMNETKLVELCDKAVPRLHRQSSTLLVVL